MSKILKINPAQKKIMVDFMLQHPDLARNVILNGAQGKRNANRLWSVLTAKLNAAGPPAKNVKLWRKVYADQKHQVKKKMSHHKSADSNASAELTHLTRVDQQMIAAAGLDNDMEGEENGLTGGSSSSSKAFYYPPFLTRDESLINSYHHDTFNIIELKSDLGDNDRQYDMDNYAEEDDDTVEGEKDFCGNAAAALPYKEDRIESMLAMLTEKFQEFSEDQKLLVQKVDTLVMLMERSQLMKQEQHDMDMALKRIDIEIKTLELQALKAKRVDKS